MYIKRPNTSTKLKVNGVSNTTTLILIIICFIIFLFLSCSVDEPIVEECECVKTVFKSEVVVVIVDGLPRTKSRNTFMYEEIVPCQDELNGSMGSGLYFDIECE